MHTKQQHTSPLVLMRPPSPPDSPSLLFYSPTTSPLFWPTLQVLDIRGRGQQRVACHFDSFNAGPWTDEHRGLLILKTLRGPPASTLTWRRPTLWSLFKLPRASDTFNIANVGVAPPLKVLLEFWGSRKQASGAQRRPRNFDSIFGVPASGSTACFRSSLASILSLTSSLLHPYELPNAVSQIKFEISHSGEQDSRPTLQLKRDFGHTSNSNSIFRVPASGITRSIIALARTLISVQRRLNPIAPKKCQP
ncbi:hypothetical protein C8R43DRAFT_950726 [Mycena crocata]|nr:hypothetical protein C8R43DRAFT_950726 [Mycena crocata]